MITSQYPTDFHYFMAKTCILLFFLVSASKSRLLLITTTCTISNEIQREFLFNVAIATRDAFLASSHSRQNTNLLKLFALCFRLLSFAEMQSTNRIQREFLFNNCIQSQNPVPASSLPRQKTNLHKPFCTHSLRSGEKVGGWGYFAPPILLFLCGDAFIFCFCLKR